MNCVAGPRGPAQPHRRCVAVAPTIEALASALVALASDGGILRTAIDALIGNLGRTASFAATVAGSRGWRRPRGRVASISKGIFAIGLAARSWRA